MLQAIKNLFAPPPTPEVASELLGMFEKLANGPPVSRIEVHQALTQIYILFQDRYGGITEFAYKNPQEKMDYLKLLLKMENEFGEKRMLAQSVACKMLGLVLANTLGSGRTRDMNRVVSARCVFEKFHREGVIDLNAKPDPDAALIHVPGATG